MKQTKDHENPPPVRGLSPWLWLATAGLLAVGLRQMLPPSAARRDADSARSQVVSRAARPGELPDLINGQSRLPHGDSFAGRMTGGPPVDPLARLLQDLQAEADPLKREQLIADFLAGLQGGDMTATLAKLRDATPAELADDLSRRVVRTWADSDPGAVAAWINQQGAGEQRELAVDNLALVWANSQLANAIRWGQSLTVAGERNRVLTAVANEAVRADAATALQLAVTLPADAQRDDLVRRAAAEWASGDAPTAVGWAEQIPDATLRAGVLAGEVVAWAKQDPESAATLAVQELPAGRLQEDTVVSIIQRWAQQAPEAAAAWVAQFPDGPLRAAAIDNLVQQWSLKDAAGAQQWLADHS